MKYKILPGHSFLDSDGTTKTGGETIELSDDIAEQHADRVEKLPDAEQASSEAAS